MTTWTRGAVARLGIDTDTAIAAELEISVSAVAQRRRRLGIPLSPRSRRKPRRWTPAEDALLGTMTDREVAREVGVSRGAVEGRRLELGVASFQPPICTCSRRSARTPSAPSCVYQTSGRMRAILGARPPAVALALVDLDDVRVRWIVQPRQLVGRLAVNRAAPELDGRADRR